MLARAVEAHAAPCLVVLDEVDRLPRETVEVVQRLVAVQDEPAEGAHDVDTDLEQPVAQPSHLGVGTGGAGGPQP